jgi:beta-glucosidase
MGIHKIAKEITKALDIGTKAQLLSQIVWETMDISKIDQRLGSFLLADGPAGIRRMKEYFDDDIYNTKPSTSYPSPSTYASSWDPKLLKSIGIHIGKEALQEEVDTMLAPAINLKRSPLGGRNFEYYSEDPWLTSELATSFIQGIQSEGVGACLKHFAVNNQETRRMNINVDVDEQTLNELYLRAFEKPVKVGKPKMVMTAYNQVNHNYCASNPKLLDILRKEWGFDGVVVTDCFAAHDLAKGIRHGLTLQMPGEGPKQISKQIKDLIQHDQLEERELDQAVERNIIFALDAVNNQSQRKNYDRDEHHDFARKVAEESMVLLKNEHSILPLDVNQSVLVVGELAKSPRFQGGGSSHVNPYQIEQPLQELDKYSKNISYEQGYRIDGSEDIELQRRAIQTSAKNDVIVIFAGLPDLVESEGYDRQNLLLPENQNQLIYKLVSTGKKIVVVLANGSVVEMPWRHEVKGILESYLGGEAGASAIANILFGKINPSGKLAETFPEKLADTPTYLNFPGNQHDVVYGEGRFIGYKYYEAKKQSVAFPFGHGLSYTSFLYQKDDNFISKDNSKVNILLTNNGNRTGKEVVQIYTRFIDSIGNKEPIQLAGFKKIELQPKTTKCSSISLDEKVFKIFDTTTHEWVTQPGRYEVFAGGSSEDRQLVEEIRIETEMQRITADHNLGDMLKYKNMYNLLTGILKAHPKSLEFLEMTKDNDPLKAISMGSLMTFNTLRRVDPTLDEVAVDKIIMQINEDVLKKGRI